MGKFIIAPSVLSADFGYLADAVQFITAHNGDWVHFDVMDGVFVPDITFGHKVVKDVRHLTEKKFDIHLMVSKPEHLIRSFATAGADYITVHLESVVHMHRVIEQIHDSGCKAGISIVPSTPVCMLEPLLPFVDLVLVMTVNPGYGGQKMICPCLDKVVALRKIRNEYNYNYLISIDGGVCTETFPDVLRAAPDVIVTGSLFFSDPQRIGELQSE